MDSLYRTYRPLTFDSVVGQDHVVSTLEHAIAEGRCSHAYLFCGPRGTGKTTMARILAKALLCERSEGSGGCMPDGTCAECSLIADGTHPDVYELDAASRTGVDNVREEIIGSVNFAPVRGSHKIYIIDEVHMLTTAAFNALLKTLEEPPAHVVFVLCTTDPHKIPETILSRCQRFDFRRISCADIVARLALICDAEGFERDEEALEIVARHARGGMRDALSTLEQLSVFGNGSVRAQDAHTLLGEVASSVLTEFSHGIASRDVVGLFEAVAAQIEGGGDLLELTRDLVAHVRDVYMLRVAGPHRTLIEGSAEELAALEEEARRFESVERLSRVLTVLDDAALEMRTAADVRLVLEIALARLARPESDLTLESLAERVERMERALARAADSATLDGITRRVESPRGGAAAVGVSEKSARAGSDAAPGPRRGFAAGSTAAPAAPAPAAPLQTAASSSASARADVAASRPVPRDAPVSAPTAPEAAPADDATPASVPRMVAPSASAPPANPSSAEVARPVVDIGDLGRRWQEVVKRVTAAQPSRGALLQSSRLRSDDGAILIVELPAGSGFAIKMLSRPDSHELIAPIAQSVFGARTIEYRMDGHPERAQPRREVRRPAGPEPVSPAADQVESTTSAGDASDEHESVPPFDVDLPQAGSKVSTSDAAVRDRPATDERPAQTGAAQTRSAADAGFEPDPTQAASAAAPTAAESEIDAADLLGSVFGDGVVIKDTL
ncbi:DNA polymerase III, subunits gamma and tau [Coriobacterium glomerans PW2]|uniref:DNA polymerase III subunit gamma/tau n=1 Tax=Coriobacterium glomerans (strain ATCC 49209 / DSM 20642 / JCM 10262 / PW2) TaxID=700015 RepID=F2N974_CORGP|nr:DNA polymerase III subunit gamma/tau [Coriobacterium glomerans]AEB07750.1 DNA polymerase III, subunits gamma and tau [Coriobacterium glomerans PW2]